jgi:hypothetical protein
MLTRAIQGEEEERRRNRLLSTGLGGRDSVRPSVSRQMTMIEARLSISDPNAQPASAIDHALSAATSPGARSPVIQARDRQDRTSQDRTRVVRGPMPRVGGVALADRKALGGGAGWVDASPPARSCNA